jgi:cell division protein FtsB
MERLAIIIFSLGIVHLGYLLAGQAVEASAIAEQIKSLEAENQSLAAQITQLTDQIEQKQAGKLVD